MLRGGAYDGRQPRSLILKGGRSMRLAVCLAAALLAASHAATGPATQCAASETAIFHCDIGKKNLSVCMLADGRVSYRYGKLGKPEITIDGAAVESSRGYPGGGETRLRFTRGAYDYYVFDLIRYNDEVDEETGTRGMEDRAGVIVVKDGKRVTTLECTGYDDADAGKVNTAALKSKTKEEFTDFD
jgi:hypothetical protein